MGLRFITGLLLCVNVVASRVYFTRENSYRGKLTPMAESELASLMGNYLSNRLEELQNAIHLQYGVTLPEKREVCELSYYRYIAEGNGRGLLNKLQQYYCELEQDATGILWHLSLFSSTSIDELLQHTAHAYNIIATASESSGLLNCSRVRSACSFLPNPKCVYWRVTSYKRLVDCVAATLL